MQYFFILGRHPELSKAEIKSVLNQQKISFKPKKSEFDFFIIETEKELNIDSLINTLGGTIKIGKIVKPIRNINSATLLEFLPQTSDKIHFGISTYNCQAKINQIGKDLKYKLKDKDIKARFVSSKVNPLSSVIVQKNHLLDKGAELVVIKTGNTYLVGQTLAVQPFKKMGDLDYGRPARDDKSGMLPPKLAQIMINLAQKNQESTLLDPFCGSGTVLQQGLLSGYKKVIGSDLSKRAIKDSITNLEWLEKEMEKDFNYKVFHSPIDQITQELKPDSIDLVVTEPYLGPPLKGTENQEKIESIIRELAKLYKTGLQRLEKLLRKDGVIVMVIPSLKSNKQTHVINVKSLLPENIKIDQSWEYSRPGQRVSRKIYRLYK